VQSLYKDFPVEGLKQSAHDGGRILGSFAHDEIVRFWDLSMFADDGDNDDAENEENQDNNDEVPQMKIGGEFESNLLKNGGETETSEIGMDEDESWEDMDSEDSDAMNESDNSDSDSKNDNKKKSDKKLYSTPSEKFYSDL
jgi:hypothetical protein